MPRGALRHAADQSQFPGSRAARRLSHRTDEMGARKVYTSVVHAWTTETFPPLLRRVRAERVFSACRHDRVHSDARKMCPWARIPGLGWLSHGATVPAAGCRARENVGARRCVRGAVSRGSAPRAAGPNAQHPCAGGAGTSPSHLPSVGRARCHTKITLRCTQPNLCRLPCSATFLPFVSKRTSCWFKALCLSRSPWAG